MNGVLGTKYLEQIIFAKYPRPSFVLPRVVACFFLGGSPFIFSFRPMKSSSEGLSRFLRGKQSYQGCFNNSSNITPTKLWFEVFAHGNSNVCAALTVPIFCVLLSLSSCRFGCSRVFSFSPTNASIWYGISPLLCGEQSNHVCLSFNNSPQASCRRTRCVVFVLFCLFVFRQQCVCGIELKRWSLIKEMSETKKRKKRVTRPDL